MRRTFNERLATLSIPEPNSGCWLWLGAVDENGYGRAAYRGKNASAHRSNWIENKGEIPPGLMVCHRCDVRSCVNLDHLFLGTNQDNMTDMARKGRGSQKLSPQDVRVVRLERRRGTTIYRLAERFGVTPSNISYIASGKSRRAVL